jgi:hypothetical protein
MEPKTRADGYVTSSLNPIYSPDGDGIVRVQRRFLSVICTIEITLAPESPILENRLGLE